MKSKSRTRCTTAPSCSKMLPTSRLAARTRDTPAPHRPSQSHGGGLELDQVPASRCHYTNHPACPDASLTPNDAQPPLAVTDPFFRRRSPADAVRFRPRPHGNAQSPVRLRTARDLTRTRVTGNPRRNCVWRPSVDLACHLPLVSARWTSEVER